MPVFRIHRMKDAPRQHFRWAPHVSGVATVRPKDYEPGSEVEAENEYAAWSLLRGSEQPLQIGDMLETAAGHLRICKYVGFEDAGWLGVQPPPDAAGSPLPGVSAAVSERPGGSEPHAAMA